MAAVLLASSATVQGISPKRKRKFIGKGEGYSGRFRKNKCQGCGCSQGSDKGEGVLHTLGIEPPEGLAGAGKSQHKAVRQAQGEGQLVQGRSQAPSTCSG